MEHGVRNQVTEVLRAWNLGDDAALEELVTLVYGELHRLARGYMSRERPGHILETTALINEAFLRLVNLQKVEWRNRDQFFAASAQMMRRILVDFARRRDAVKRGGEAERVTLSSRILGDPAPDVDLLALDELLTELAELDERKARVVELRFFAGLTVTETAALLDVSQETVMRDWKFAKAWLYSRLKPQQDG
jgi:RNA polymerase sigma factor (TIGR02999 family)